MNIIIPAAGTGQRFIEAGYATPKPLINVLGEPMVSHVIRNLSLSPDDKIHIVYTQDLDKYQFRAVLRKEFPEADLNFIPLLYRTRGPVETVLCGLNQIEDLDQKTLVLDCDTFYLDNILGMCREEDKDFIFYFTDTCPEPIFSYLELIDGKRVYDIREKERISDYACSGAYGFRSGRELKKYCERVLNLENKARGEYYLSSVYAEMIKDGATVIPYPVQDFHCLGTPQQLQTYCLTNDARNRKRFCFDLDGTLVTFPEQAGDYKTVQPIMKNVKLARSLYDQGHTIIIQTARKMLTAKHNAGEAAALASADVFATLAKYNIPFDEIYFGNPHAHFYINDLSVKPYDCEREMGFYDGAIEPRAFNQIEYGEGWVKKTTNNSGEVYWYRHIPQGVREHFALDLIIDGQTIQMEKIKGIVLSYLLVNNSLTRANLQGLLDTLEKIHTSQVPDTDLDYMANYNIKIAQRYFEFNYLALSDKVECFFLKIAKRLASHKPVAGVIHGDPVFSNVFLCDHQLIRLIDMRGKVGETETIFGDIFYDYAKVYQSLYGYDFILNDCEINVVYLRELREVFEAWFTERFSAELLSTLRYITASLFFSLIPLHRDGEKQKKYLKLVEEILSEPV